jgi:hypothetical protein
MQVQVQMQIRQSVVSTLFIFILVNSISRYSTHFAISYFHAHGCHHDGDDHSMMDVFDSG